MQDDAHARQIISHVRGRKEVTYVLVSKPVPGGFLTCIVGHTKALSINFVKQGGTRFSIESFTGYAWLPYSLPPFIPSCGYFQGIPSSYWSNDDVINTSYCFLLRPHLLQMSHSISGIPT